MMQTSKTRRIVLSLTVAMFVVFGLGMSNAFAAEQGTVTMSIEKATLGQGFLIAPAKVTVNDGETVETVTKRFLDSTVGAGNYSLENGYLSAVKDPSMKGEDTDVDLEKVPQYIKDASTVYERPITTKANKAGWLSTGDFNEWGGYSYKVNDTWGGGMSTDTVKDGDVVRIGYTIVALGSEWAVTGWEDGKVEWPTYADKKALLATMAAADELALEGSDEYKAAVTAATALPGDEAAITAAQTALQAKVDAASAFDGTATVSVEKFVLGQGYIIEPTTVPIKSGENAEAVLKRVVNRELGYGKIRMSGWNTYIADDDMKAQDTDLDKTKVPSYIMDKVGDSIESTAANEAGWLGSNDFITYSGFVAERNNTPFPDGFAKTPINDGDVVRFGFSLAMGSDWQKTSWQPWEQEYANVDDLQETMAAAQVAGLEDTETYKAAVTTSSTLPGDQSAVNNVKENLQALIDGSEYPYSVVVDVEKFTMGQGFLVEPKVVKAKKGETAADVIKRYLDETVGTDGYKMVATEYGAYLAAVKDDSMKKADTDLDLSKVPSYIKEKIDADKVTVGTAAAEAGWLTEKDFCSTGGFMYTVNDNGMDVGIDGYTVQDNDVIRIGYSLYGYGNDWYKTSYQPWDVDYAPKAQAIAAIADANQYGVTGDSVDALKEEAAKLPGDQKSVDDATKKVMDDISEKVPGALLGNAKGQGYDYKRSWTENGEIGTTGQGKKMTGMKFKIDGNDNLGVSYEAHVANVGWMDPVADGEEAGQGDNTIEAVKIKLTGADADKYDVFYRAHVANVGWTQWTKNGEMAGTSGFGYAIEAIEAYVAPKGYTYNHSQYNYKNASQVAETGSGEAHIQNIGWGQGFVSFNQRKTAVIGTSGQSLRVEGIILKDDDPDLTLTYNAHCQNAGWTGWKNEGEYAGTEGHGWRMEAVQIKAEGANADKYDIEYRAHVQNIGWMPWVKNGETAGTEGRSLRVEAIQIRFVEK
ncbi:MAG: hypothetical protein IJG85_06700 [Eubacteriaceae bacterium]|nr:hypothetical protein [Eubacteriaceae bacterium]